MSETVGINNTINNSYAWTSFGNDFLRHLDDKDIEGASKYAQRFLTSPKSVCWTNFGKRFLKYVSDIDNIDLKKAMSSAKDFLRGIYGQDT